MGAKITVRGRSGGVHCVMVLRGGEKKKQSKKGAGGPYLLLFRET